MSEIFWLRCGVSSIVIMEHRLVVSLDTPPASGIRAMIRLGRKARVDLIRITLLSNYHHNLATYYLNTTRVENLGI
jgi:hypothetical protein